MKCETCVEEIEWIVGVGNANAELLGQGWGGERREAEVRCIPGERSYVGLGNGRQQC